jgi:enoyl-CoA hydratase
MSNAGHPDRCRSVSFDNILYEVEDRIARISLNRPETRNCLSFGMRRDIVSALREAEQDDNVSVVLIEGIGPSFCSGYDLSGLGDASERPHGDASERPHGWVASPHFDQWTDQFARSCLRDWMTVFDLLKPVVAKVHGHCLAGGSELMSMCDITFVANDAVLGYPPMRGMSTPDVPYFPWKMNMAHAKYLQLTGNSVSGKEAAAIGWVAKSFPVEELEEQVMRELRPIARISPALLAANKASLNHAYEVMGMRVALQAAWQLHLLSGTVRADAGGFADAAAAGGLKAALDWMNSAFQREGFPL